MKKLLVIFLTAAAILFPQNIKVKTGIEVLRDSGFEILLGKRVGLITNPTGVDSKLKSTVDILFEAPGVTLTALYGPEHGVRGDFAAGDKVDNYIDQKTKIPVYSLYGKTHKPTPEMLKDIDVLVYDIQDIGCRSYTYIATMGEAMEAAAENKIPFVVLDRPNPLGGNKIEGNIVEDGFYSFVSPFPVPYIYGLTCGELAKMLNEENMISSKCDLTVIPMEGWRREMTFRETGLQWIPTSPHVPHNYSPEYYVCSGILGELGVISEGVGYTIPFQVFAAEWIDASDMAAAMNSLNLEGVIFRPITIKPFYGRDAKKSISGVQIHLTDYSQVNLMSLQFYFMQVHNELYPEKNIFDTGKNRWGMFDKVSGTSKVRELFSKNYKYADIKEFLHKDIEPFRNKSSRYFLYN
jgi:uncharacterized protein YbbC (DUF1343 family)